MTELRRRMLEDMRLRNLSLNTQKRYLDRVAAFAGHFGKSPELLGPDEIRAYQLYLVEERRLSSSSINVTVCALKFLYRVTLGRPWEVERVVLSRREKKLPVVLSQEEVARFFAAIESLKYRAILVTAYAAGLRVTEVTRLKVSDIDSSRMTIRVDQGKGQKDRYVMLSGRLLGLLREYWKEYRPSGWLFPGKTADRPVSPNSVRQVCREARVASGFTKQITPHTLRHNPGNRIMPSDLVSQARYRRNHSFRLVQLGIVRGSSGRPKAGHPPESEGLAHCGESPSRAFVLSEQGLHRCTSARSRVSRGQAKARSENGPRQLAANPLPSYVSGHEVIPAFVSAMGISALRRRHV